MESRTQVLRPRTQKNPRPRTALSRTDPLEAKDRIARGQEQDCSRPRTGLLEAKDTAASVLHIKKNKKGLQKSFSGNLQFIGVARIFDWGGVKLQTTCNDVIKNFQKRNFLSDKDIVGWKIGNRCLLALNQDFVKGEGLN